MWTFFNQLWQSVSSVGTYTAEWFLNIGRAVGGALGDFFLSIIHIIIDFGILLLVLIKTGISVFNALLAPVLWLLTLIYQFFSNVIDFDYVYEPPIAFDSRVATVLNSIPFFSTLALIIVVAFYVLLIFKVFKILARE